MNHKPAIKVLLVSSHADTRVAVSWMLRQSFPDAIVSKAESISEAAQTARTDNPACVIGDASLPGFALDLPAFAQSLKQEKTPLIVIHDSAEATLSSRDEYIDIAAWLVRENINVSTINLAISRAIEHSQMSFRIESLESELAGVKTQLESALAAVATVEAQPETSPVGTVKPASTQQDETLRGPTDTPMATTLERPGLSTNGLSISNADERELAARVQNDLMPPGSPLVEGFDIAGLSIHAEATGGDYYDYLPMADDLLGISIGECSGRGLAPAMMMASLRAYLRVLAAQTTDISDIVSQANTLITEDIGDEEFIITLMLFQIDDRTRTLRYASAGHQAFFLGRDGDVDVLHSTGMPLGLRDETVIPEGEPRKLRTGEILLLASDGVQKMTSETGEQFGTDRMLKLVNENRSLPSRIIANYLRKACTEFASPQFQHDDVTIVIVKGDNS